MSFFNWSLNPTQKAHLGIALFRVALGILFLKAGINKMDDLHFVQTLPSLLQGWASHNPFFWYQDFLNGIAVPNAPLFAKLVTWGEVACGLGLILGLWMPVTLGATAFLSLNFLLATQHLDSVNQHLNALILAACLMLWMSQAGYCYGLDTLAFPAHKKSSHKESGKSAKEHGTSGKVHPKSTSGKNKKQNALIKALAGLKDGRK